MIGASLFLSYPSSLLYSAIPSHSMPIHIQSLLFLFISSVLISLFVIVLNFSFSFILISTHPILSLLLYYSLSILQSISSSLLFHTLLSILPHYSTPFSFILSFPFSIFSSSTHHSSHSFLSTSSLSHSILIPSFILFHFNATLLSSSSSLFYIQLL
ncbi:hypothetical protein WA538_005234, partial [Blastocystis sp. DL]